MSKKYCFTGETKQLNSAVLHRIQALRDFSNVKKGDLGGWIEKEDNLSHDGTAWVRGNACVSGNSVATCGIIIGNVSLAYKDIFQYQCEKRVLTAILTEDDEVLYSIGCQKNITKEVFIDRIHNEEGGIEKNPHRKEYLRLIKCVEVYFGKEKNR